MNSYRITPKVNHVYSTRTHVWDLPTQHDAIIHGPTWQTARATYIVYDTNVIAIPICFVLFSMLNNDTGIYSIFNNTDALVNLVRHPLNFSNEESPSANKPSPFNTFPLACAPYSSTSTSTIHDKQSSSHPGDWILPFVPGSNKEVQFPNERCWWNNALEYVANSNM